MTLRPRREELRQYCTKTKKKERRLYISFLDKDFCSVTSSGKTNIIGVSRVTR